MSISQTLRRIKRNALTKQAAKLGLVLAHPATTDPALIADGQKSEAFFIKRSFARFPDDEVLRRIYLEGMQTGALRVRVQQMDGDLELSGEGEMKIRMG